MLHHLLMSLTGIFNLEQLRVDVKGWDLLESTLLKMSILILIRMPMISLALCKSICYHVREGKNAMKNWTILKNLYLLLSTAQLDGLEVQPCRSASFMHLTFSREFLTRKFPALLSSKIVWKMLSQLEVHLDTDSQMTEINTLQPNLCLLMRPKVKHVVKAGMLTGSLIG